MLILFMLLFYVVALIALLAYSLVALWDEYALYRADKRAEQERKASLKRFKALYRL